LEAVRQKYVNMLSGDIEKAINVYDAYLSENDMILGDKYFDIDTNDFVDGIKYKGTSSLYELIFKRIPDGYLHREL